MRRLHRHILFLLFPGSLLSILQGSTALAQAPPVPPGSSTWWYPLGNPEGTRRNPAPTLTESPDELTIKWRTTALKNSPVVLVGGLRLFGGETQQIVGMEEGTNRLIRLSEKGRVESSVRYDEPVTGPLEGPLKLRLTGLFSSDAPTPTGVGRPNLIGIGVEREQRGTLPLYGILAGPDGRILHQIPMSPIPNDGVRENRFAGVYPASVFKPSKNEPPIILAYASQFDYISPNGDPSTRNQNGIWRYNLEGTSNNTVKPLWRYPIAPGTYPQQPAVIVHVPEESSEPSLTYIGASTRSLPSPGAEAVPEPVSPGQLHQTRSTSQYSISLDVSDTTAPRPIETRRMPPLGVAGLNLADSIGETHSYFFRLDSTHNPSPVAGTHDLYRVVTSNYSQDRPGIPVLLLAYAEVGLVSPTEQNQIGLAFETRPPASQRNKGWTIVAADTDGSDFGTYNAATRARFPANTSDEIVAAYRDLNGADIKGDSLFVYRLNYASPDPGGNAFWAPVRTSFDGRLLAAADLVKDPKGKQELVIADGNTLSILRLRAYDDVAADVVDPEKRRWFDILKTFTFDSPVVTVAIADLEGSGHNDLVVVTKTSTYAIGRQVPNPLGSVVENDTVYCPGDTAVVTWGPRIVGGGEEGLSVHAIDLSDSSEIPLIDPFPLPDTATTHAVLTYRFPTPTPGSYEVVIRDKALPYLETSGGRFTITTPLLGDVQLPRNSYVSGDPITFGVGHSCTRNLILERRSGPGEDWTRQEATFTDVNGDSVVVSTSISCIDPCRTDGFESMEFRLRDTRLGIESGSDSFAITARDKRVDNERGSRSRYVIRWNRAEFGCDSVRISLTLEGRAIRGGGTFPAGPGEVTLKLDEDVSGPVLARVCCTGFGAACDFGKTTFEVEPPPTGNYVQPNPFDPNGAGGLGASIYYTLEDEGPVTITIIDAARAVVRRLIVAEERGAGLNMEEWDGRNSAGEIVANGTYICIVESGDGRITPLPIFVRKL